MLASSLTSTVSRDNSGIAYGKEIERENIQTKNKVRERDRERERETKVDQADHGFHSAIKAYITSIMTA